MEREKMFDTVHCDPSIVIDSWMCFGGKMVSKSNHGLETDAKHKTEWMGFAEEKTTKMRVVTMMKTRDIEDGDEREEVDSVAAVAVVEKSCVDHEKNDADIVVGDDVVDIEVADDVDEKPVGTHDVRLVGCIVGVASCIVDKGIDAVDVDVVDDERKKVAVVATSDRSENEDLHQPGSG